MLIANPLYDVVFKYMLEDKKVAKLLFAKGAEHDKSHTLNIPDGEVPKEYFALIRRLLNANVDAKLRGAMELEDEILEELRARERKSAEKDKIIEEKDKALDETKKTLESKAQLLKDLAKRIAELEKSLPKP